MVSIWNLQPASCGKQVGITIMYLINVHELIRVYTCEKGRFSHLTHTTGCKSLQQPNSESLEQ